MTMCISKDTYAGKSESDLFTALKSAEKTHLIRLR